MQTEGRVLVFGENLTSRPIPELSGGGLGRAPRAHVLVAELLWREPPGPHRLVGKVRQEHLHHHVEASRPKKRSH